MISSKFKLRSLILRSILLAWKGWTLSLKHILYSQVAHKSEKFDINKGIGLKKWTKLDCYLCHQYKSFYVPNIKRHFHKSHPGVSFARELVQKANAVDVTDSRSRRCDAAHRIDARAERRPKAGESAQNTKAEPRLLKDKICSQWRPQVQNRNEGQVTEGGQK